MKKVMIMAVCAVAAVALTGCANDSPGEVKEDLITLCKGHDKLFVYKDSNVDAAGIFVVPDHKECAG
jgi:hypothetical protein